MAMAAWSCSCPSAACRLAAGCSNHVDDGDGGQGERYQRQSADREMERVGVEPRENLWSVHERQRRLCAEAKDAARGEREEEFLRADFEGAGREYERREWKWRRNQIENGERDRAAFAYA